VAGKVECDLNDKIQYGNVLVIVAGYVIVGSVCVVCGVRVWCACVVCVWCVYVFVCV
jgi:hypothetical protein